MTSSENNDFERRVKSSLETYQAEFNPSDWRDMEIRLNAIPAARQSFQWSFSTNIFVAILACTGVFFLIYKASSSSHSATIIQDSRQLKPIVQTKQIEAAPTFIIPPQTRKPIENTKSDSSSVVQLDPQQPPPASPLSVDNRLPQRNAQKEAMNSKGAEAPAILGRSDEKPANVSKEQKVVLPDDPSHIRIYGDMIDPKQGFIYNTKETIGAPLSTEARSAAWIDNGSDGKKASVDSLKSILSPEVKFSEEGQSNDKAKTKTHRLRRGKNTTQDGKPDSGKPAEVNQKQNPSPQGDNNTVPPSEPAPQ
jgi:hypothetical protein